MCFVDIFADAWTTLTTNFILQNVLLTKDILPIVKVADFGLAKAVDGLTMLRVCPLTHHLFISASE